MHFAIIFIGTHEALTQKYPGYCAYHASSKVHFVAKWSTFSKHVRSTAIPDPAKEFTAKRRHNVMLQCIELGATVMTRKRFYRIAEEANCKVIHNVNMKRVCTDIENKIHCLKKVITNHANTLYVRYKSTKQGDDQSNDDKEFIRMCDTMPVLQRIIEKQHNLHVLKRPRALE